MKARIIKIEKQAGNGKNVNIRFVLKDGETFYTANAVVKDYRNVNDLILDYSGGFSCYMNTVRLDISGVYKEGKTLIKPSDKMIAELNYTLQEDDDNLFLTLERFKPNRVELTKD